MSTQIYKEKTRIKENFSGQTIYCGIDVHKASWNVTTYIGNNFFKTHHQEADPIAFKSFLENNFPGADYHACYEAGFSGFSISRALKALNIECCVVHPSDVPTTGKDKLSKTDKRDSKKIAKAFAQNMLTPLWIPSVEIEGLRKLLRFRYKIQGDYNARRQSIKSLMFTIGVKIPQLLDKPYISKNYIKWLEELDVKNDILRATLNEMIDHMKDLRERLLRLYKEIKKASESQQYDKIYKLLVTTPGIGLITAMTFIAEIGDIDRFECFRKFNSYVGFCPSEFSSGDKIMKGKITTRANKVLRCLMIEAAWRVKNLDPAMAKAFTELITMKNKKRKDAIVIIARKLLSRVFSVWKNHKPYEKGIKC